ncbi:MAG: serine O-acetyltransferase [Chloroflexi bacterium]|nr:serine O-acetyltransferase [Chloroflexota bacterium]
MSIREDINAIFERDPAAANIFEVLLAYPGLHALLLHRLAHWLQNAGVPLVPRLISQFSRSITFSFLLPGASIGKGFFIDHGMGVVIGETAEVGDNVTLYQGVTLGGTGKQKGKRHPTLRNNITVGVGAKVLGAITIGDNVRVGAGSVVLKDVPSNSTAVGVPAKVVAFRDPTNGSAKRVEQLPDPEAEMINCLHRKIIELEDRIIALEGELEQARGVPGGRGMPAGKGDAVGASCQWSGGDGDR